uniref:Uncharacterized protein n=1 Tax=Cannabis sativa TaxID=3483 RepID=A0A803PIJ4_CANSA
MVNIRRTTPATTSASSSLPQDPMAADPNVHDPITNGIPTNPTYMATPATSAGTTNLASTTGQVDTTNPVSLNDRPMPPREDPPLALRTKQMTHVE